MQTTFPKRAIHLDFHTMPGVYDVGRDFDAEEFARTLREAGVDYITAFARCNLGFAYYPTRIGTVHPGLKIDLLGRMVAACHKHGIRLAAYFNAGLDHEHALRHREWCKVNREGQVYQMQDLGPTPYSRNHFFRKMCLNTGYGDHLLDMVREILEKYPVDGLFLDCFTAAPCYGIECLDAMKAAGVDFRDERSVSAFAHTVNDAFADRVIRAANKVRKDLYLCFNGMRYRKQPRHFELEILPTGGAGYDRLPFVIRYVRTLGKPYFTMTGRFHGGWGDFGGLRTKESLLFDCFNSVANGGTCSIGDHMHPRGRLEPAIYRLIGEVYNQVRELDPWTDGAKALADMVVVDPLLREYPQDHPDFAWSSIQGAARMLMELKYQFDLSDGDADLSSYKVIILADYVTVDDRLKAILRNHLKKGGILISSGFAGLNPLKTAFALSEYGINYQGPEPWNVSFFKALPQAARDLPDMPTTVYKSGIAMTAKRGTQTLARLFQPYFNKHSWDGRHENAYIPPEKDSARPAVVQCGNIIHFAFPIFQGYGEHAVVPYKLLLRNCLERVFTRPLVRVQQFPSFGQVTVTKSGRRRIVHLLTYLPELRGSQFQVIEEPITAREIQLALRLDHQKVSKVYLAPSGETLPFKIEDGYAHITVPQVCGYQMVVFE